MDTYKQISRFITNNQQLERLNARLKQFNPFKVLKVDQYEIRHSNMLGWLLDPKENHFMGDTLLKKVLAEILCGNQAVNSHELKVTDVILGSFQDAEVYREWRNIDILVVSKKNDVVLFFENKIHAGLAEHQQQKYLDIVKDAFPGIKNVIPVFLTLQADESPHSYYYSFSHAEIMELLKSMLSMHSDRMQDKIYDFISYYVQTLEELTLQDEQMILLCREIYKNNKEAIEAIIRHGRDFSSTLNQAVEKSISRLGSVTGSEEDNRFFLSNTEHWFMPDLIKDLLPTLKRKWKSPYPLSYFFIADDKKLTFILEVGPIDNIALRRKLIDTLSQNSLFKSGKSDKYTRIRTSNIDIDDWYDIDQVSERLIHLLDNIFKYDEVNQALIDILRAQNLGDIGEAI